MLTIAGKAVVLKNMLRGTSPLFAIAIGDGGADPVTGTAVAPQANTTALNAQIFYQEGLQFTDVITSGAGSSALVRHTFNSATIPTIGREVKTINEVGLFAKDPDTKQAVLIWIKTFQLKPNEKFRLPATGKVVSPDKITILEELFQS